MQNSRTVMAIGCAGLLVACGQKTGGHAADQAVAPAAQGAAPASGQVVSFSDLPHPRAGLWKQVLDDGDGKPATDTVCFSGKAPAMKAPKACSQFTIKRALLGGFVMDMRCSSPEFSLVSHAELNGDFQNKMSSTMTMTITSKASPSPQTSKMNSDYTFIGQCAPGQKPEDDSDPNAGAAGQ